MTRRSIVVAVAITIGGLACGNDDVTAPQVPASSSSQGTIADSPVDLTVHLVAGAGDDDVTQLILDVLSKPPVPGRQGQDHLDGVQRVTGDYRRFAVRVTFFDDATEAEVDAVVSALEASAIVERVEPG